MRHFCIYHTNEVSHSVYAYYSFIRGSLIMSAEVNALIVLAQLNETKGFYRRALRIWREVSTHFDADKTQCRLASEKIDACHLHLQIKSPSVALAGSEKKQLVERDKIRIQQLLKQGYSIKEVQLMTGRSSAFIYKYNPRSKPIH